VTELILNPHLRIRRILVDGQVTAYALSAPVRGRGKLTNTLDISSADADVVHVLDRLVDADADVEVQEAVLPALIEFGVLVPETDVPGSVRFAGLLEDDGQAAPDSPAIDRSLTCHSFADVVAQQPALAQVLEPCAQLALVTDPVTGARYPYSLGDRDHELLQNLARGAISPAELTRGDARRLARAGILVDARALTAARDRLSAAVAQFARHGYAELRQLVPAPQVAALRGYYRRLLSEGHAYRQDGQVELRHALHNEVLMRYYHHQLCGVFSQVVGQSLTPSYGYFASYRRGATLAKHCDRKQCAFTVSLLLDYVATPGDDPVWPLYLELPRTAQPVAVEQVPGDCVLFAGCDQPHFRNELRAECSTSLLFHYVDAAFSGSLS
jgi:hypothetical protein